MNAFRLIAVLLLVLGFVAGVSALVSTGVYAWAGRALGLILPWSAGLGFAIAWWRKAAVTSRSP